MPHPSASSTLVEPAGAPAEILKVAEERLLGDDRGSLIYEEALQIQALPDDQLTHLTDLAHRVRLAYCGDSVEVESIISGKTGGCPEDCHFCSQSSVFGTEVAPTGFIPPEQLLAAAHATAETGATEFCIVYAVRGPDRRLMDHVLECTKMVYDNVPGLEVACSLGILTRDQALELAAAGVHRYNHNLESSKSYFPEVCSTHTWEDRWDTCQLVRETGMELCSGGIIGLGESREQRIEFAFQLSELEPHEVPMNFLNPRAGTPMEDRSLVEPMEAIRTIALFRLIMPSTVIRYAGGREVTLGDLQAMGLKSGVNALITGNYLTTLGQNVTNDLAMLEDLKMPIKAVSKVL
ncbi:MAG TPA: biotin synthase BioB [Solirubrobacterales bacterium]|jgi:biotin synthase|nr:biotin synthase BioB [Solirubrobacterales bacterium]